MGHGKLQTSYESRSSHWKPNEIERGEQEKELDKREATVYRRAAARLIYMSLDRADLSYASKEASRGMSRPTVGDSIRLKRILRYLRGSPRVVNQFVWQEPQDKIFGYSDSDWAGCTKTRKSSSGGCMLMGKHLLAQWSSTQTVIALSSAEAELNAIVKMFSETIGLKHSERHGSCNDRSHIYRQQCKQWHGAPCRMWKGEALRNATTVDPGVRQQ